MDFMTAVKTVFRKYVDFSGRAPRAEFWYFQLFILVVEAVLIALSAASSDREVSPISMVVGILLTLFGLGIFLPALAVQVRRLHDIDKSGWWMFIQLVPLVGGIILLVFLCRKSTDGANRFGPNPYGHDQRVVEAFR